MKTLSIIIPVYNERYFLKEVLDRVISVDLGSNLEKEIILVNDASTDGTTEVIRTYLESNPHLPLTYIQHERNKGKGAAIHTGLAAATGDMVLVQDADLEYDPRDYSILLQPILEGKADVVYGSRFIGSKPHRVLFFWHYVGNRILTLLSNAFTNLNLTDMETCYKVFRKDIIDSVKLREERFGFEPEVTARISKIKGIRIFEVGVSYNGRTYGEGKKINWKDGFRAIYCILRYNLFK